MSRTRLVLKSSPSLVRQSMKFSGPAAIGVGAVADVLHPVANFPLIFTVVGVVVCIVLMLVWMNRMQHDIATARTAGTQKIELEHLRTATIWGHLLGGAMVITLILGGVWASGEAFGAQKSDASGQHSIRTGLLAHLPIIADVQQELFNLNKRLADMAKDLKEVKESTTRIEDTTKNVAADVKDIKEAFAALAGGGVKPDPQTPQDWYHNAVVQVADGNEAQARKSLEQFLKSKADYIDPHLQYQRILKAQEGLSGAREIYNEMEQETLAFRLARALLQRPEKRIQQLEELTAEQPEFGPAWFSLAHEFSPDAQEVHTLAEARKERDYLQTFIKLDEEGNVYRWFLDKRLPDQWRTEAADRLSQIGKLPYLDKPVMFTGIQLGQGNWGAQVNPMEAGIKAIWWRKQGDEEWTTTGEVMNPATNQMTPNTIVTIGKITEPVVLEAKYADPDGVMSPVYTFTLDPLAAKISQAKSTLTVMKSQWVTFREYPAGQLKIYFTMLISQGADVIKEIRYSLDSEALDLRYPVDMTKVYTDIPFETESVSVQVVFADGTESEVVTIAK